MTHKVVVQNEQFVTLKNTAVEIYDTATGETLGRTTTDAHGIAEFEGNHAEGTYWFKPQITRRSGKNKDQSMGGAVSFHEVDAPVKQVTKSLTGKSRIPQDLRGNLKVNG